MQQRTVGYLSLAVTWLVVVLCVIGFLRARGNPQGTYYWCWVLLCPTGVWLWVVTAWCNYQLFRNAKPRGYKQYSYFTQYHADYVSNL
ncbi:Eri1p KNAG_0A03480 [Huiozyma naganishii CBS 8797]|uniref:Uncharacterized protein n=1 Tax=Huiozyma naganishii (strain ATCC MYA-139 / BCRC 22969 / CBS 8797 / KCTC 17520 / NBRC 10181 / NCYC 3082 / Yp74L-3) TaxID=1071383 RepID=J7S3K8_HUIN7|nr:hypothetical protein KNAG_0A03480 [Kazachstania naganishii CBS 8797]CCK68031.1 hypothetical protein KNAG_0A03480 [Kazachstania naganishii CBS 8797]